MNLSSSFPFVKCKTWKLDTFNYDSLCSMQCYVDPSHELKFHSKPEVLRYLNNEELNNPKSQEKNDNSIKPKSQDKNKLNANRAGKNVCKYILSTRTYQNKNIYIY